MKGWTVEKMHDHCKDCAECAASAVEHAIKTDATVGQSALMNGIGQGATILHHAKVTLREDLVKPRG